MSSPIERLIRYNLAAPGEQKKAILYGTERGRPIVGTMIDEFPSFLVGGQPGFGKTSAVAFFCCQVVMAGGRLLVIDPHCNAPRDSLARTIAPLRPWFIRSPIDFSDVDTALLVGCFESILDEYEARKRPGGTVGKQLLYLVVDEWNELLDCLEKDELERVLLAVRTIARGGRKYGMWVCLAAQNWTLEATGGSQIRKNLPGRLAFHMEMADMRLVLDTRDSRALADLCTPPLQRGHAIMKRSGIGIQRVRFPLTTYRDCEAIARLVQHMQNEHSVHSAQAPTPLRLPAQSEYSDALPSLSMHVPAEKPFGPSHLNVPNMPPNVRISQEEYQSIVELGNKQLAESGKVIRTKIQKALGWDADDYAKIKAVCDALGWHASMQQDRLSPAEWQAILDRYDNRCVKCGCYSEHLEPDRIIPAVKGGSYTPENVQPLCKSCNSSKREQVIDYRKELV